MALPKIRGTLPPQSTLQAVPESLQLLQPGDVLNFVEKPFDRSTYDVQEEVAGKQQGGWKAAHFMRTVRCRRVPNEDGKGTRLESNARVVQWEDGSRSIMVGEYLFDVGGLEYIPKRCFVYKKTEVHAGSGDPLHCFRSMGAVNSRKLNSELYKGSLQEQLHVSQQILASKNNPLEHSEQLNNLEKSGEAAWAASEQKSRRANKKRHERRYGRAQLDAARQGELEDFSDDDEDDLDDSDISEDENFSAMLGRRRTTRNSLRASAEDQGSQESSLKRPRVDEAASTSASTAQLEASSADEDDGADLALPQAKRSKANSSVLDDDEDSD